MEQKTKLRELALALRKKGLSYNEIRRKVPVSKSSLSLWLKDVPLSPSDRERLYTKQINILARGPNSQRERRKREVEVIVSEAKRDVEVPLSSDTFRFLGAALYWAEGSKTKSFEITNSDPLLIVFIVKWFKVFFNIEPRELKVHLNIYPQQDEELIKKFWSGITGIPTANFGKSFVKPFSSAYKKNNLYYGTIKVRVPKGTDRKLKVYAWLQVALQDLTPRIESAQRKWSQLKVDRLPVNLNVSAHSSVGRAGSS